MRTLRTYATCWLLSIAIVVQSCHWLLAEDSKQLEAAPSPEAIAFFESKIRPVLIQRCIECHRDADPESGLSLESRAAILRGGKLGPALVPGNPKESLLISAINHDEFLKMPPKDKLSTAELVDFAKWVTMGAPWPASTTPAPTTTSEPAQDGTNRAVEFSPEQKAFWAYQPLQPAALPEVKQSDWGHSPIDAFILEKLEQKGLSPAPPASKSELIRRATYDLTGLPPTREQIDQFVADQSPDAFAKLIDRLLASPHYGEHWGRHWLDVARFADSNGLDENIAYANAFRYRDYVTSSLNNDKTYDRFVQEQIAGDLLDIDSDTANGVGDPLDRFVATGFLAIGAKMLAEDDPVKMQMDIIDEQLSTLCQAFMGITIGCARCHDHKFDPITAADYYALAGIFKSTQTMENHKVVARWYERPLVSKADQEQLQRIDREIELTNQKITKLQQDCRKRVATEIRQTIAAALLTEREYDQFSQAAATRLSQGQNHPDRAYSVPTGYALIEAEGFQRGKAERDLDNYGKGIGVIISHGASFVEYDLEIDRPGRYALEMRHAAEERRPVRVLIDGAEANPAIAVEITGNWQPEGQQWFVETMLELPAGKHVLRLETSKKTPFPHIDKFALVHQTTEPALNGETPLALSRVGASLGISYPLLAMWQKYLGELRKATDKTPEAKALFELWTQFRNIRKDFSAGATPLYESLGSQLATDADPLAKLRDQLKETKPSSLAAVAQIFDTFIAGVLAASPADLENKKLDDLRKQLLSDNSPLSGPKKDFEPFYNLSEQEQTQQLNKELAELRQMRPNPPMAMGVTESKPEDLRIHLRGSHIVLGKMVPRRFPQILAGTEAPTFGEQASGRLELARWMTRPEHPLTSRVMVNRLWHWHFGRGLVTSVDNFGLLGQKPSHPELLDWLAIRFVQQRWSIKQMHRTLMLSQTYQMSTALNTAAAAIDPSNDWLWRFRRRRLTAEETRDSIISVGEGLDRTLYGTLLQTENHKYVNSTGSAMAMDASRGRRSLYLPVIRSGVFDVMQTLDFPDPAMLSGERQTSTVAPQALLMMNSDLVHEHTAIIARQLLSDCRDDAERISQAYSRILQRSPSIDEVIAAATFIRQARQVAQHVVENQQDNSAATSDTLLWQGLCRVLISSNEFSYVE